MPEFDGALVRSADDAMLVNLNKAAGSQIRGVGIFASISGTSPNRNSLPSNNRVDGYIAVVQDVDKVYIFHGDPTTNWTNTANWTELGAGSSVSSDSFSVISVSGQSNVEANGAESTVEFIAGTNINVTTDATNDTVTFATPAELTADITGNAETVTTAAENSSTSAHFVTFTDTTAGDADIFTDTGFKYKPSANALLLGAIHNPNDGEVINLGASGTAATFTGNVTGQVSDISNFDTDDLAEGSNLYFTDARVANNPAVTLNTAKVGITSAQASAIVDNSAKVSFPGFGTTSSTALRGNTTTDSISEGSSNLYYTETRVTNNTTVADHTSKLAVIKPKVDHISVTQAVDLDDMESDINSNTTTLTNIENVLKSAFTGGGAGIYSDSNKGTSDSFMGITSTTAIFQAGGNTKLSMSETSPGSIDLFVQAGSTGNEAAYKAVAIDGSNTSATAEISLNGSVVVTGTVRNPTTISFNKQATPPTAIAGGLYADTSDNLYFGVS